MKNALSAQGDRSVFQKLREAALAYHLERKWSKEKILTQYLNTVYFGNGAYGIESAMRTYFGDGDEGDELHTATDDSGVALQPAPVVEDEDPIRTRAFKRRHPGGGRHAGRDDRLALDVRPATEPGEVAASGATWCSRGCSSRA